MRYHPEEYARTARVPVVHVYTCLFDGYQYRAVCLRIGLFIQWSRVHVGVHNRVVLTGRGLLQVVDNLVTLYRNGTPSYWRFKDRAQEAVKVLQTANPMAVPGVYGAVSTVIGVRAHHVLRLATQVTPGGVR